MDYHDLQRKLFELDPTDPREDLAKLKAAAVGGNEVSNTTNTIVENYEVPEGSLAVDKDYSLSDFAALAGIRLDEKQKMGAAGQAKGRDPMPSTSKPSKSGEQKHPLKDKLVGEAEPNDQTLGQRFMKGVDNYNKLPIENPLDKLRRGNTDKNPKQQTGSSTQQTQKVKGGLTGQQLGKQLGVSDPNIFNQAVMKVKQGQPLNRMHMASFSEAFQKLMQMDPQSTQKVMTMLKRMEAQPAESSNNSEESIKERLYRELNKKMK